jgi:hypothetical protein
MSRRALRFGLVIGLAVVLLFLGRWEAAFLADRWWAGQVVPGAVPFVSRWELTRISLESAGLVLACAWFVGHLLLVHRAIGSVQVHRQLANLEIREAINMQVVERFSVVGGLLLGVVAGRGMGDWTPDLLLAWAPLHYGTDDPLLGHDLGFYVARLPLWRLVHGEILLLTVLALGASIALYAVIGAIRWTDRRPAINDHARYHLGAQLVLLAVVLTVGYLLEPAELVAGVIGTVHGGLWGYRVVVSELLAGGSVAAAVLSCWWMIRGRHTVVLAIWALLGGGSLLGHHIIPALVGGSGASALEPEARRHIDQLAYGLTGMRESTFTRVDLPPDPPQPAALWHTPLVVRATAADSGTVVAADRAVVPVGARSRAGWLVVRDQGPRGARVTALLDDRAGRAGDPVVLRDGDSLRSAAGPARLRLPPRAVWPGGFATVVDTASAGVQIGTGLRRVVLAWALQEGGVLGGTSKDQRLFWYRDPQQRLARLIPFAAWGTPVPRLLGGELVWLVDGYLASRTYPGSTRVLWRGHWVGALRASFVGVIHAESGATTIYLRHTADDLAKAWQTIADSVIQPASAMPADVARALPYPAEALEAQLRVLQQEQWGMGQPLGRGEGFGATGPSNDAIWESDTSGAELLVPFLRNDSRQVAAVVRADETDGWEALTVVRLDSLVSLPEPALLQNRWGRFATYQQLKDSVEKVGAVLEPGPVRFWLTRAGLGAYQPQFALREGQEPVLVWLSLTITDRSGAGHDLEEAWQNLLGLSAPIISAQERGALLFEARRHLEQADQALRRGDLEAFGREWERLRQTLRP